MADEPGRGTTFDLCFPAALESETERGHLASQLRNREAAATILVVEDEPAVRGLVRQTLAQLGYTVLEATDGYEALRVIEQHQGELQLLVTDVVMPLMNGYDLKEHLTNYRGRPMGMVGTTSSSRGAATAADSRTCKKGMPK